MGAARARKISLPVEHGGWITLATVGLVAVLVAPAPGPAIAVTLALLAAFAARGPLDRLVAGATVRRWDAPWLGLLGVVAAAGAALAGSLLASVGTAVLCLTMVGGSMLLRWKRHHRAALVEAVGLAALGAGAGWAVLVGGSAPLHAVTIAIVLAANAAMAVPLVRTTLRRNERGRAWHAVGESTVLLALAIVALVIAGQPWAMLALAPRALLIAWHAHQARSLPGSRPRALVIGLRETASMVATVVLLVLALRVLP